MTVGQRTVLVPGARYYTISLGIASGQSTSDQADLFGLAVDAVRFPASWTAAALAFDETPDTDPSTGPNGWAPCYDDGGGDVPAEYRLQAVAGISMRLNGLLDPYRWVRFRSVAASDGSAGYATAAAAAVPQVAARTLVLLARSL